MGCERRGLIAALAASLLVNLFLGGVLAGGWLNGQGRGPGQPGGVVPGARVRQLAPAERARFAAAAAPHRPAIRAARQLQQAARAKVEADIAAPRYDRTAVTADFAALREAQQRQQAAGQAALVDALSTLSPASRAALVARANGLSGPGPRSNGK